MSTTTLNQNATMYQGEIRHFTFKVYDEDGTPTPVTDVSLTWILSATVDGPALITKTTPTGVVAVETAGEGYISLVKADTESLDAMDYYHELRDNDNERVLFSGTITLLGSITK